MPARRPFSLNFRKVRSLVSGPDLLICPVTSYPDPYHPLRKTLLCRKYSRSSPNYDTIFFFQFHVLKRFLFCCQIRTGDFPFGLLEFQTFWDPRVLGSQNSGIPEFWGRRCLGSQNSGIPGWAGPGWLAGLAGLAGWLAQAAQDLRQHGQVRVVGRVRGPTIN